MSSVSNQYSSLPPLERNQDRPHLIPFFPSYKTSSFQHPISRHPPGKEACCDQDHRHQQQEVDDDHIPTGGPSDSLLLQISMPQPNNESEGDKKNIDTKNLASDLTPCRKKASKWMSSKMRLMRKMMGSTYAHEQARQTSGDHCNSISSSNGPIRVCSDCKTTKTPLWRSGPQGPKSLCNACGIRRRKARKAMAAAATMTGDPCSHKEKAVIPNKKRHMLEETSKKINLEDFSIGLKKSSAFHAQDEKEAAILLMALSCDLIYG